MIRITAAGALLCAAAALAACGSSDDTATSTAASAGPAKELKFELTDDGCTPADAKVEAGAVKIVASNPASTKTDEIELKNADGIIMGEREIARGMTEHILKCLDPSDAWGAERNAIPPAQSDGDLAADTRPPGAA